MRLRQGMGSLCQGLSVQLKNTACPNMDIMDDCTQRKKFPQYGGPLFQDA